MNGTIEYAPRRMFRQEVRYAFLAAVPCACKLCNLVEKLSVLCLDRQLDRQLAGCEIIEDVKKKIKEHSRAILGYSLFMKFRWVWAGR